jgi:hypothetical protein
VEAQDPLSDLADIHLPGAISFWPPAPGWWLLALLALGLCVAIGLWFFRRWQQRQRLRVALQELTVAQQQWQQSGAVERGVAALNLLHSCNSVLKRVALVHYPAAAVAALNGNAWLQFLDRTGATTAFTEGACKVLADGAYRRQWETDEATINALLSPVQQWITQQYVHKPRLPQATVSTAANNQEPA